MANVSNVDISIRALTAEMTSGLSKASGQLESFRKEQESKFESFKSIMKGVGAAIAGYLGFEALKSLTEQIANVAHEAAKLGTSSASLTGWHLAAERLGVDAGEVDKAMEKLSVNLISRTPEAAKAIQQLGLNLEDLRKQRLDQQVSSIAGAMEKVANHAQRLSILRELAGKGGGALSELFRDGNFAKGVTDAQKFGTAISELDTNKVLKMKETWGDVWQQIKGIATDLLVALAPALTTIGESFGKVLESVHKLTSGFRDWVDQIKIAAFMISYNIGDYLEYVAAYWKDFIAQLSHIGNRGAYESDPWHKEFNRAVQKQARSMDAALDQFIKALHKAETDLKTKPGGGLEPLLPEIKKIDEIGAFGLDSVEAFKQIWKSNLDQLQIWKHLQDNSDKQIQAAEKGNATAEKILDTLQKGQVNLQVASV